MRNGNKYITTKKMISTIFPKGSIKEEIKECEHEYINDNTTKKYTRDDTKECYTIDSVCKKCNDKKVIAIEHSFSELPDADFGEFHLEGCATCSLERAVKPTGEITYDFNEYGEPIWQ